MSSWTMDAGAVVLAALLVAAYCAGIVRVRKRGLVWPARRSTAWFAGVASLLLVTLGPLGGHAHTALWVYTVQVLVLLLGTPVVLAYGRPLALAVDALPPAASARVLRARTSWIARAVANPAIGPLVVPVVLGVIFFSPVLSATLEHTWAYELMQLVLVGIGLLIAIGLVGDGAERDTSLALAATVAIAFIELLFDAVPGIVLRLRTHLVATAYWTRVHGAVGTRALTDQQHAGAALWFIAEFADLPFLLIVIRRWIRVDQLDAVRIDRDSQGDPEFTRPWWETDPTRLLGHPIQRSGQGKQGEQGKQGKQGDPPEPT
jgi:putative membrane protein